MSVTSSPSPQPPVNEHFLHPHPEDPSHTPQSHFPQPGHNLGANVEIRNHGTANLQPQASLEPQPVFQMPHQNQGSVVNRPLFDPTTVDLNTDTDPHANHPVFQAVPDDHFLDQAPPPHPQMSWNHMHNLQGISREAIKLSYTRTCPPRKHITVIKYST